MALARYIIHFIGISKDPQRNFRKRTTTLEFQKINQLNYSQGLHSLNLTNRLRNQEQEKSQKKLQRWG
ncbi:MAG: hypothetical protein WBA93_29400, partial [Microcoleaceae cyanobacterium]